MHVHANLVDHLSKNIRVQAMGHWRGVPAHQGIGERIVPQTFLKTLHALPFVGVYCVVEECVRRVKLSQNAGQGIIDL